MKKTRKRCTRGPADAFLCPRRKTPSLGRPIDKALEDSDTLGGARGAYRAGSLFAVRGVRQGKALPGHRRQGASRASRARIFEPPSSAHREAEIVSVDKPCARRAAAGPGTQSTVSKCPECKGGGDHERHLSGKKINLTCAQRRPLHGPQAARAPTTTGRLGVPRPTKRFLDSTSQPAGRRFLPPVGWEGCQRCCLAGSGDAFEVVQLYSRRPANRACRGLH